MVLKRILLVTTLLFSGLFAPPSAPLASTVDDDFIVAGSLCAGLDCITNESFDYDTLRLKENNIRLEFQDTSDTGNFPTSDWRITINDVINDGDNYFAIDSVDNGLRPFKIAYGAPDHGLHVGPAGVSGDNFAFPVLNMSGSSAGANEIGYIDEFGQYQTTTALATDLPWAVVVEGGADGSTIYVARRGRVRIAYTGTAPTQGDYLVTSTTDGQAQRQTTMHPNIFAIALDDGSGGVVDTLLLTGRSTKVYFPVSDNFLYMSFVDNSDFVATISASGISGDKVYYNAPSSGSVTAITPVSSTDLAKIVLHNTTAGQEALIIGTGSDGGGDFIQVSDTTDVATWMTGDTITGRSQTNTTVIGSSYWLDVQVTSAEIPPLATGIAISAYYRDTATVDQRLFTHPFSSNVNEARQNTLSVSTATYSGYTHIIPLFDRRLTVLWEATGTTGILLLRIREAIVATP